MPNDSLKIRVWPGERLRFGCSMNLAVDDKAGRVGTAIQVGETLTRAIPVPQGLAPALMQIDLESPGRGRAGPCPGSSPPPLRC